MDNFNPVITGSLKEHVVAKLGGKNKPKLMRTLHRWFFELGEASTPDQVTETVRDVLGRDPPALHVKMIARAAGSVVSGFSPIWYSALGPNSIVGRICEVDDDGDRDVDDSDCDVDHEFQDVLRTEMRKGWDHPWRRQSWEREKQLLRCGGRPPLSEKAILARLNEARHEAKNGNWDEVARITTNVGQALRRRAKPQRL